MSEERTNEEGFIMVFKRCKCGMMVGCIAGDGTKDGDLIDHDGCKLKKGEKKWVKKANNLTRNWKKQ